MIQAQVAVQPSIKKLYAPSTFSRGRPEVKQLRGVEAVDQFIPLSTSCQVNYQLVSTKKIGDRRSSKFEHIYKFDPEIPKHNLASLLNISSNAIQKIVDKPQTSPAPIAVDKIIIFLERLVDGWAGEESVAPKESAIRDLLAISYFLPPSSRMPEIEVDPDDGGVSLIWTAINKRRSFALIFNGNNKVVGTMACLDGYRYIPWSHFADQEVRISIELEHEVIMSLVVS